MPQENNAIPVGYTSRKTGIRVAISFGMAVSLSTAVSLGLPGCLIPPDIDERVPVENQAPRIVHDKIRPTNWLGAVPLSLQCPEIRFLARLADPDLNDEIFFKVFINYSTAQPEETLSGSLTPEEWLYGPLRFSINPKDLRFNNALSEPHQVELLIADRAFDEIGAGRDAGLGGSTDSVIWTTLLTPDEKPCEPY